MASSLLALLMQQSPNVQTRKGLILTGLQNDFLSSQGKLPSSTESGFIDRLRVLVPAFREYGNVVWVRSHFQENREVNYDDSLGDQVIVGPTGQDEEKPVKERSEDRDDSPVPQKKARLSEDNVRPPATPEDISKEAELKQEDSTDAHDDEELFLSRTLNREPCCIPGSFGAEYGTQIKDLIDPKKDMQLIKTYYSAFGSTSLLLTLRSKLITELYICGCTTNLSVFATAMDAARYGIKITLVEDCLGYRRKDRHDMAIKQLREIMEADVMTSVEVIERLRNPPLEIDDDYNDYEDDENDIAVGEDADGIHPEPLEIDHDSAGGELSDVGVRPSTLSGRMQKLCCEPSEPDGLPEAAIAEQQYVPPFEPPEPPDARAADPSSIAIDGDEPRNEQVDFAEREQREHDIEQKLSGAAGDHGVKAGAESSKRVTQDESHTDIVLQSWRKHEQNASKLLGRSSHPGLAAISALSGLDQATVNHYEDMMEEARQYSPGKAKSRNSSPLFGDGKVLESRGSRILYNLLPPELAATTFEELNSEVVWQRMHHQTGEVPRLVSCQASIGDGGSMPVYRHPSDQTLPVQSWTPSVSKVRKAAEEVVGHPLNHALIQLYRGGTDYISEHSDKTLDIVKDSFIVNVSFGAQRKMRLRTKRTGPINGEISPPARTTYRVPMPHNSMITMSLATNAEYLHGINADKRPAVESCADENAFGGQRISLTFRNIGTFLSPDSSRIWGQGATEKDKGKANAVINGDTEQSEKLVRAFGAENQSSTMDWEIFYGGGFDVLHLK